MLPTFPPNIMKVKLLFFATFLADEVGTAKN